MDSHTCIYGIACLGWQRGSHQHSPYAFCHLERFPFIIARAKLCTVEVKCFAALWLKSPVAGAVAGLMQDAGFRQVLGADTASIASSCQMVESSQPCWVRSYSGAHEDALQRSQAIIHRLRKRDLYQYVQVT